MPNPNPKNQFAPGHKINTLPPKHKRSIRISVTPAETEYAKTLGFSGVTEMCAALISGDAVAFMIAHEYPDQIAETVAHINALIEANKYEWHPSHTEDTLRGLAAQLERSAGGKSVGEINK